MDSSGQLVYRGQLHSQHQHTKFGVLLCLNNGGKYENNFEDVPTRQFGFLREGKLCVVRRDELPDEHWGYRKHYGWHHDFSWSD